MKSCSLKIQQLEESQTLALTSLARKLKEQGVDVLSLTAGEPDFPTPAHIKMAAIQAIEENFTRYTANEGIPQLIKAITQKFEKDNNLVFQPDQIVVSTGAKQAIFNSLQAICNPGDEVVIPAPYWVSYPEMVKLVDANPVFVNAMHDAGFKITARQLRQAINAKTKALIFNSPSNPTGAVYSQGEIEELADVIAETGIYVVSDEIYEKVVFDGAKHFSIGSIKQIKEQVVTVNGVSKAYSMTGWRIGYLGAKKEIAQAAAKIQSQVTSNANSIAQKAAVAALSNHSSELGEMVTEFKRRRDYAVEQLKQVPEVEVDFPKGAFLLFPYVGAFAGKRHNGKVLKDDMDICQYLIEEEHLVLVPGSAFGAKNYLRLSYACSMKELEEGVKRLRRGLEKLRYP
ncbi:MAG: pyridoxal phosphate-dependent aminotransferase [Ignavibacteriae bacterium]|nr:pyridoxal phosphate-dependent aminotransferase [Ignavibacteriota bacterium]